MSVNAVNGFNNANFGCRPIDPIKPETRQRLRELNIDEKSVKTETQARHKIADKEEQLRKDIREQLNAQASSLQAAQAGSQIQQPQPVQGVGNAEKVDGIKDSQQVQQIQAIEQQHAIHNQQQGNEHVKAFAASQQQITEALPFEKGSDLVAMYNKVRFGLI